MIRKFLLVLLSVCILELAPAIATAQSYPSKPILIITPFSPGAAVDLVARLVANNLREQLKTSVLVDNRLGANGMIGTTAVARAAPDGHTVLFTSPAHYISQYLYKNMTYDPVKDFRPVTRVSNVPLILVVPHSAPPNTLAELIAYIRARPGKLSYASAGSGSTTHLPSALLSSMANLEITHIPYKGGAQAVADVIRGEVLMTVTAVSTALPHIKASTLKGIGVAGAARSRTLPNVPTIAEGGLPGYEFTSWNGMLAPVRTPQEVTAKLEAAILAMTATPEFGQRMLTAGLDLEPLGAKAFADRLQVEIPMWARVVAISGAKAE